MSGDDFATTRPSPPVGWDGWEPPTCCLVGQVYIDAFARAARAMVQGKRWADQGLIASQLAEVVDHLVTMHGATGERSEWCAACARFDGPPGPDMTRAVPGHPPPTMSTSDWAVERRAHHVTHTFLDGRLNLAY